MPRLSPIACLLCWLLSGCYLMHGASEASPDADRADTGTATWDGGLGLLDVGLDVGLDASTESGTDAGTEPDADLTPPLPGLCRIEPTVFPFSDPVLEYRWPDGPVDHPSSLQVCSTPLVIDLVPGGDGRPQLVFLSYATLGRDEDPGILRIVDPAAGTTVSHPATETERGLLEATSTLAAGDIDGDGLNEIVGIGQRSGTYAFRSDGTLLWSSAFPTADDRGRRWGRSIGGAPTLADLEGDGTVEVIVGHNVLEGATGAMRWVGDDTTGYGTNSFLGPIACAADLDGDGIQEVIAGHTAFRADGSVLWNTPTAYDGFCAVADMDPARPGPEVVLSANGYLRILDGRTGAIVWVRRLEGRVRMSIGGAPTVADFDGDGSPEVGVAHGAAYAVYDPACTGAPLPPGCTGEGVLWRSTTEDGSSSGTGSSVFDFNGDGRAEVVYNDQFFFRVYDGVTGRALFQRRNSSRTRTENPTIADVDNDGDAEIVFSANNEARFLEPYLTDPGVEVWGDSRGRWVGARRIWNQHAYHITNVSETGTIASPESPSWTALNAYRQNLREGGDVLVVPDLWGGRGTYTCTAPGRATLEINVQNWGLERVGAGVLIGFYRGEPGRGGIRMGEARTTRVLEPRGGSEVVRFNATLTLPPSDWFAVLDEGPDGGGVAECREDNNRVLIWRPQC